MTMRIPKLTFLLWPYPIVTLADLHDPIHVHPFSWGLDLFLWPRLIYFIWKCSHADPPPSQLITFLSSITIYTKVLTLTCDLWPFPLPWLVYLIQFSHTHPSHLPALLFIGHLTRHNHDFAAWPLTFLVTLTHPSHLTTPLIFMHVTCHDLGM